MMRHTLFALAALAVAVGAGPARAEPPKPVSLNLADEDKDLSALVKAKGWELGKAYNLYAGAQLVFLNIEDRSKPSQRLKLSADEWKALAKSKVVQSLSLYQVEADDDALKAVAEMQALEIVTLSGEAITDAGLKHLVKVPRLWVLRLDGKNVTDEGIAALAAAPALQVLYLSGEKFTGKAFAAFAKSKLERLELWNLRFGDEDAKELARTGPKLGLLQLLGTGVTAVGLRAIAEKHVPQYLGFNYKHLDDELFALLVSKGWLYRPAKEQVSWLPRLPVDAEHVSSINLNGAVVTDAALKAVAHCPNIEALDLRGTRITDAALLAASKAYPKLQSARVGGTKVTGKGAQALAARPSLTVLDVGGIDLDEETLKAIGGLKKLRELGLSGAKFDPKWLNHLTAAPALRTLNVESTAFDDAAAAALVKLAPNLESLSAGSTKLGDAGLKALAGLPKLRTLYNYGTAVTKQGVAEFKKANPKCFIPFEGRE